MADKILLYSIYDSRTRIRFEIFRGVLYYVIIHTFSSKFRYGILLGILFCTRNTSTCENKDVVAQWFELPPLKPRDNKTKNIRIKQF